MAEFCKVDTFQHRFRVALAESDYKKTDIANKLGVARSVISRYSKDVTPKDDKVEEIAKILNVNSMWLLGYDVEKERVEIVADDEQSEKLIEFTDIFWNINIGDQEIIIETIKDDRSRAVLLDFLRLMQDRKKDSDG